MDLKSIEKTGRLYWLGRYTERVYTTLKFFEENFDELLGHEDELQQNYCSALDIPNIYNSTEDFLRNYPCNTEDPNSIISNLLRAYDNAIELREAIGSEALSYIQLTVYEMQKARLSTAPMIEFQKIHDYILAFWGLVDDAIETENVRNILKLGKRIERIDLYARLHRDRRSLQREVSRLVHRAERTELRHCDEALVRLQILMQDKEPNYGEIVRAVDAIIEG